MANTEKALINSFRQLPAEQQQTLLDFAEFLNQRYAIEIEPVADQPLNIPRPPDESVVKAIKRLSKTYPMLDTKPLFEKTSSYMMRNLMHGEEASVVIDEMEIFFEQHFQVYYDDKNKAADKK